MAFKIASATVDAHVMRLTVSRGTRRPFAILAWVLVPLVVIFIGAGISQADQSSAATLAQQEWAIHAMGETTALQTLGRNVRLPNDLVADTSASIFLVGCGRDFGRAGCWVDQYDVQTATAEIVKATAAAGMRYATTTCDAGGLRCDVVAELSGDKGEIRYLVVSPRLDAGTAVPPASSTNTQIWQSEVSATVLPQDVFAST